MIEGGGCVIARDVLWARTRRERAQGLLNLPPLEKGQALVLEPARQVHTFGLAYAIDVVFCDADWVITHLVRSLPPRRVTRPVVRSRRAIELPAGAVPLHVQRGTRLFLRQQ